MEKRIPRQSHRPNLKCDCPGGLFDQDLYIEHGDDRYGPYSPSGGPIPLYRYRRQRNSKRQERAGRVAALAERLGLPRAALEGHPDLAGTAGPAMPPARQAFADPDPFREFVFTNRIAAKLAIADMLGMPLARLSDEDRLFIDQVVAETLERRTVMARVKARFQPRPERTS